MLYASANFNAGFGQTTSMMRFGMTRVMGDQAGTGIGDQTFKGARPYVSWMERQRPHGDATADGVWTGNVSSSMDNYKPMPVKETIQWHVAADMATQATWYGTEFDQDQAESDAFFASCADLTTTVDVTPTIFPGVPLEPDETGAAQDLNDGFQQETDDPWWSNVYGFPDYPPEFLAPPEATVEQIQAAHPTGGEHDFPMLVADETSDYQSYVSEQETPTEWFPPPSDAEAQAAQPLFDENDLVTHVAAETEDYGPDPSLDAVTEWPAPPTDAELQAAQPSFDVADESAWIPLETDDYQTSSPLDTPTEWPPPPSDVEAQAEAQLAEQPFFPDPETEDYDPSVSLDVTSAFFPPATVEPDETHAAQPIFSDWFFDEVFSDDGDDPSMDVAWKLGCRSVATESFNQPDSAFLGPDLPWTALLSSLQTVGNVAEDGPALGADSFARAEVDVCSSDMYAQVSPTFSSTGSHVVYLAARYDVATDTAYVLKANVSGGSGPVTLQLFKRVSGTNTSISSAVGGFTAGGVARIEVRGTHVTALWNGSVAIAVVDASISTGQRGGIGFNTNNASRATADNFEVGALGAVEPDETFAAQPHGGDLVLDPEQTDDYANDSTLEVSAQISGFVVLEPDETFAAQPHYGDLPIDEQFTEDYGDSTPAHDAPTEWPPPPSDAEAQAEQPYYGEAFWPDVETEDYADAITVDVSAIFSTPVEPVETLLAGPSFVENDPVSHVAEEPVDYQPYLSELETVTEWPPPPTDAELLAAQPSFADDLATYVALETDDYANDSTLEIPTLFPTPPTDGEAAAAQPHFGDLPIPAEETEDYANDAGVDVAAFLSIPLAAEPIETFAAQPPEQPFLEPAEETTDYDPSITVDVTPFFTPAVDEIGAAQPHHGELPIDPEETQDYANDSSLEIPTLYPAPPTDAELLGAQPGEQPYFDPAEETTDYDSTVVLDVAAAFAPTPDETIATQPFFGDLPLEPEETTDYDGQPSIDVAPFLALPVQDAELLGAQPHFGDLPETYVSAETEDYQADSTLDVSPAFFAPAAAEVFAAQPHYGEWFWEAQETEDYTGDSPTDVVAAFFPPAANVAVSIDIIGIPDGGIAVAGATETGVGISGIPEAETDLEGVPDGGISIIGVPDSGASAE